jgi:hypothetical protein
VSWEIINTNPVYEMFRLDELEQEQNENIYVTLEEIETIEQINQQINKKGYISGSL